MLFFFQALWDISSMYVSTSDLVDGSDVKSRPYIPLSILMPSHIQCKRY